MFLTLRCFKFCFVLLCVCMRFHQGMAMSFAILACKPRRNSFSRMNFVGVDCKEKREKGSEKKIRIRKIIPLGKKMRWLSKVKRKVKEHTHTHKHFSHPVFNRLGISVCFYVLDAEQISKHGSVTKQALLLSRVGLATHCWTRSTVFTVVLVRGKETIFIPNVRWRSCEFATLAKTVDGRTLERFVTLTF